MSKDKKEKKDNTQSGHYWEGYEDGYSEGETAGYEEGFNDAEANRSVNIESCEFCEDLEAGACFYEYEEDDEGIGFTEFKAWFCPQCGRELPTGPRRDKGGKAV